MSMAASDTGSSFVQWAALYHHDHPSMGPPTGFAGGVAADASIAATSPTSAGSGGSPTTKPAAQHQPGIEGSRAGKPERRRSRASRRAPVTLLNTDTANFRAMVQQFTGIPAPPAGAAFGGAAGAPVISFAADYGFPPPAGVMSFDHHLHRSQTIQDQLRRQQQQYTGGAPLGYSNSLLQAGGAGGGGDLLFASAEDRMLLQSMQQAAQHMPPASASNHSANSFFA